MTAFTFAAPFLHALPGAETEPKEITAKVVVPWMFLQACAYVVSNSNLSPWQKTIVSTFCIGWLKTVREAGGHYCPVCGELWANTEAAQTCFHDYGMSHTPLADATLRKWMEET